MCGTLFDCGELRVAVDVSESAPLLSVLKMTLRGEAAYVAGVKEEACEDVLMPCDQICFSPSSCSSKFRCSIPIQCTVDGVIGGYIDPLEESWFTLDVVQKDGKFTSMGNRRLLCVADRAKPKPQHQLERSAIYSAVNMCAGQKQVSKLLRSWQTIVRRQKRQSQRLRKA